MIDTLAALMQPQMVVTLLAAIAAFATALTVLMPVLNRDRLDSRMQIMALERDKMRRDCRTLQEGRPPSSGRRRRVHAGCRAPPQSARMFYSYELRRSSDGRLRGQARLSRYVSPRGEPIIVPLPPCRSVRPHGLADRPCEGPRALGAAYVGTHAEFFVETFAARQSSINRFFLFLDMLLTRAIWQSVERLPNVSQEVG